MLIVKNLYLLIIVCITLKNINGHYCDHNNGHRDRCASKCPCKIYEGDCDKNSHCIYPLVCKHNVGKLVSSKFYSKTDVCLPRDWCHTKKRGTSHFCSSKCKCRHGDGDCDSDSECVEGTICKYDIGDQYGFEKHRDVCVTVTTKYPTRLPTTYPSISPSISPSFSPSEYNCLDKLSGKCQNNIKDTDESDIDCGGLVCNRCPDYNNCKIDNDCKSTNCNLNGICDTLSPSSAPSVSPTLIPKANCCSNWSPECYTTDSSNNYYHSCSKCGAKPCESLCNLDANSEDCATCCQHYPQHETDWHCSSSPSNIIGGDENVTKNTYTCETVDYDWKYLQQGIYGTPHILDIESCKELCKSWGLNGCCRIYISNGHDKGECDFYWKGTVKDLDQQTINSYNNIGVKFYAFQLKIPMILFKNSELIVETNGIQINKWITNGDSNQLWKRCYQRVTNNSTSEVFHATCNNKGPTITVAKLNTGKIIGGYADKSWGDNCPSNDNTCYYNYKISSNNFLFSLTNSVKHDIIQINRGQYHNINFGPSFGGGIDWGINNDMTTIRCSLGVSYACHIGNALSNECIHDFCGTISNQDLSIEKLEVWYHVPELSPAISPTLSPTLSPNLPP